MQAIDLVQVISTVLAFTAAASKLISATAPFWGWFPPIVQRVLPGALLVLGALPSALAGVDTGTDLTVALLGALALALPGRHTDIPREHPPETKRSRIPPPIGPALALLAFAALTQQACAAAPPTAGPCTVTDFATMELKAQECERAVAAECPEYKRGTCSKERGAPCPECPAVERCARWFEERCAS